MEKAENNNPWYVFGILQWFSFHIFDVEFLNFY